MPCGCVRIHMSFSSTTTCRERTLGGYTKATARMRIRAVFFRMTYGDSARAQRPGVRLSPATFPLVHSTKA